MMVIIIWYEIEQNMISIIIADQIDEYSYVYDAMASVCTTTCVWIECLHMNYVMHIDYQTN